MLSTNERQPAVTSDTGRARASLPVALGVFFTLAATACGLSENLGEGGVTAAQPTGGAATVSNGEGLPITVERVIDGDSVVATGPDGEDLEIRLIGVNAPEGTSCHGDPAREALERLLDDNDVRIEPWPAELDDFGRTLAFLWTDRLVNLELVQAGQVVARAQSDHPYTVDFEAAETIAADQQLGVWSPSACGEPPAGRLEIVELLADAPGDDRENPNGEWVLIENTGDIPVDLDGWSVRDESTRHRHTFGSWVLEPGRALRLRTGCGVDDRDANPAEVFWCDPEPPVWNNGGDTAFLLDPNGSTADHLR